MASTAYYAAFAKARAMFGNGLKRSDYDEILRKRSIGEIATYLRQTGYNAILDGIDDASARRFELEERLRTAMYFDYAKLKNYLKGGQAKVFFLLKIKFEIELLKMSLRMLNSNQIDKLDFSGAYALGKSTVDFKALLQVKSFSQFIDTLKGSPYYNVLSPYLTQANAFANLFTMEMALDMYFYTLLYNSAMKNLSSDEQAGAKKVLGRQFDLLNIIWIARCKHFFNVQKSIIYSYLIPNGSMGKAQIVELVECESFDDFKAVVSRSKYKNVFDFNSNEAYDILYLRYMHKRNLSLLRNPGSGILALYAYIQLKTIEVRDVISMIEGVRYGIDAQRMSLYLIGTPSND